jgi:phytoene dehydrogenase-like protein
VDSPASGLLAYSIVAGRQQRSWSIPLGGSAQLPAALLRCLADHGATVLTERRVAELVLENGRCVGVRTEDGEEFRARRAVLSTIHVKRLVEMAPAEAWGEDFLDGVETYDPGLSIFAQYYATTQAPELVASGGGTQTAVSAGVVGWPEDVLQAGRDVREGKLLHTVKLLSMAPWNGGDWDALEREVADENLAALRRAAPNVTDDVILAEYVKSPVAIERANEHMFHGTIHGGDRSLPNDGPRRPVPGWAQHRMPIPGLYQTGATTHPGGSVTGGPGRNAAIVMLEDLGHDPREVLAAPVRGRLPVA